MLNERVALLDITAMATAYSTIGGALAGFAFTGFCVYLSRGREDDDATEDTGDIKVKHVAVAIFYAMISLAISSILYANLSGVAESDPKAAVTALLSYGIILSLSILSLFYSVALMALEHRPTKDITKHIYWAVTIAGTVIALRFLAEMARDALMIRCRNICGASSILSPWGIELTLLIAASLSVLITIELLEREPIGKFGKLRDHPAAAPLLVFIAVVFVTTIHSLYLNTRNESYTSSPWIIYVSYATSIFLVTLFAVACGRVVAPRAEVNVKALAWFGEKVTVKLWQLHEDPNIPGSSTLPGQSASSDLKSVKVLLVIVATVSALAMTLLGGGRWYLALFVLGPAIAIVVLVAYSCRKDGKHSKASLEAENSMLQ